MKGRRRIPFLQRGIPTSKNKRTKAADNQKFSIANQSLYFTLTLLHDPRHIFLTASNLQNLNNNNLDVLTHSQQHQLERCSRQFDG